MIDLIIFDLDGVLVNTEQIHFEAVCDSIHLEAKLSYDEIHKIVKKDGTTTRQKLLALQREYGLFDNTILKIDNLKQEIVLESFKLLTPSTTQIGMLYELNRLGYCLAIGSNSRKINVDTIVNTLKIREFFSFILCAENIFKSKPDPEVFDRIISLSGFSNDRTLILEDSISGHAAAIASGAHLLKINSCDETTLENILHAINQTNNHSADGRNGVEIY